VFTEEVNLDNNYNKVDYYLNLVSIWSFVLILSSIYNEKLVFLTKEEVLNFYYQEFKDNVFDDAYVSIVIYNTWEVVYLELKNFYIKKFDFFKYIDSTFSSMVIALRNLTYVLYPSVYRYLAFTRRYRVLFSRTFLKITKFNIIFPDSFNFIFNKFTWQTFFSSFYFAIKSFVIPLLVSCFLILVLIDYYNINFIRQLAAWAIIGLLFFWLMSGFNFFLKRYRFGKFTSAIQRFWKRTNTYFWMIEGFLFCLFFYYYINSSQEVYYFFDESNLNQNFLTSLVSFYISNSILVFLIMYSIYLMLNLPNLTYKQQVLHLKLITLLMVYIFLLECYQFYYVITLFSEIVWDFDNASNLWTLNWKSPKLRVKTQYLILALIAKYWHFLFIFFSWLFLVLKSFEQKRIHYTLFGVNLQNCILLFILNILFNINWIKWVFRRFYDTTYYWFFLDFNNWASEALLSEFSLFFLSF